ncbi:toxin-antitoxin system YwqK family antitoxin [Cochleicola gelatinilyticus]|uniref:Uncharacterized protein n=1 Tax=Cochleicola gelatinilyticus TaxID=1763537 RepID=A0A167H5L1_9FLAO|nr:hypothetical protein [Cochleicola gelatinilyticus]OAB78239.1 hypothetical protein ULVI_12240 [Cochleicola gelatinilyticus]
MKNFIILIFIIFIGKGFSQNVEPPPIKVYKSEIKTKIENGRLCFFDTYDNKKLNRKYEIFLERTISTDTPIKLDSQFIVAEGNFKNGYKHGLWKTTYESKLVKTENYNNGLMIGRYRVYDLDGDELYRTTLGSNGNGKYKDYYYKTGVLKEEGFYKNGKKEGEWCEYDKQGNMVKTIKFENGVPQ